MASKRPEEVLWYVHAPTKKEHRDLVDAPPPSNIPYLNGVMDTEEEINKASVVYFRETDSDFVKLSKLGGREDLLIHKHKTVPAEAKGYPQQAWWTDMLAVKEDETARNQEKHTFEVPAWFAHQSKLKPENIQRVESNYPYALDENQNQVLSYDNKQPIEEPKKYGELRNFLHPIKMKSTNPHLSRQHQQQKQQQSQQQEQPSKRSIKRMPAPTDTNMSKLIGNSYQQERPMDFEEWRRAQSGANARATSNN